MSKSFHMGLNNCFRKIQDRLGTKTKAGPLHELVHTAWNVTVLNGRVYE